jgi:hypothetical protein
MRYFRQIGEGIPVDSVMNQIYENPELWSEYCERTKDPTSPHYGVPDIWLRYRAKSELTSPEAYTEQHFATFYPAWGILTSLHPIVFGLMFRLKATYLGGVLITKIPPGGEVRPHDDRGSWHAEAMETKVYVALQSNPKCVNTCLDESLSMKTGEAWTFDNQLTHSVRNDGDEDRVTAIVCMSTK